MFFEPRPGIGRSQSSLSSMQTGHWAVTGESLSDRQHHNTTDIHIVLVVGGVNGKCPVVRAMLAMEGSSISCN